VAYAAQFSGEGDYPAVGEPEEDTKVEI